MSAAQVVERCLYAGVSLARDGDKLAASELSGGALSHELLGQLSAHKQEILAMLDRANNSTDLARVLGPLSAEEVAAIRRGSLYRESGPDASPARAREASRPPAAHVSHTERESRHPQQPMKDADRVCAACGARGPLEGPVPAGWDHHAQRGRPELLGSCSATCRSRLGFTERRPR